MQDLEGVDTLRMNGARATFTLKEGVSFDETKVAAVFAERRMQLETFAKVNPPRPQSMRVYEVKSGLG
mgnify:CR=1 FL=1